MSVTVLFLGITLYDSMFLEMLLMRLGVNMLVSMFVLRGAFLVERMLYCCAYMWPVTVDSEIGLYLVTLLTVNSVQD